MFTREGWPGIIALILFIVLAYDVLKNWVGATSIENSSFTGGVNMIKALQGR
jgi:hypothetical protein